jgi:FixJ family two-component response regulator
MGGSGSLLEMTIVPEGAVHILGDDTNFSKETVKRLSGYAKFQLAAYPSYSALLEEVPRLSRGCILVEAPIPSGELWWLPDLALILPLVVSGPSGDVGLAVSAMKQGAFDYIERPFSQDVAHQNA